MKPDESSLTHLDLFSGIGGFSLGFERAGFRTIGFSEIDPYACAVLKRRWPGVPNYGDLRTIPATRCTVITGGFPCQPFSQAGQRRGEADDRNLWPAMRDVISRCRPDWVVCENVPGAIKLVLDTVLADLEDIGYAAQPFVVPANAAGLPQIDGSRLFVVASSVGDGRCGSSGVRSSGNQQAFPKSDSQNGGVEIVAPTDGERRDSRGEISEVTELARCQAACKEQGGGIRGFRGYSGRIWPAPQSTFDRVDYGIPGELDRVKCLGNAVCPALAQVIAETIRQVIEEEE